MPDALPDAQLTVLGN